MFECHTCFHRCLRGLFADLLHDTRPPLLLPRYTRPKSCSGLHCPLGASRIYSTAVAADVRHGVTEDLGSRDPTVHVHKYKWETKDERKEHSLRREDLEQELRYLKDPLKLANHTIKLLRTEQHQKALELVKLGSRDVACVVSWNHLIDYEMSKGRVNAALKLYNDMKKRAQVPDSYTYTMILRGLASHPDYPQSLSRALSIYHSMYVENSPVRPSVIHTNAVLKVCARSGDLDALFGVAARLPDHGRGAADNLTFTTILNAVRTIAWQHVKDESEHQRMARRQHAVLQARRMWGDIVERWQQGELVVDEGLVGAMGRVLLLGVTPQDYDDILSLVEQTMAIPRQVPRLNDPRRRYNSPVPRNIRFAKDLDSAVDRLLPDYEDVLPDPGTANDPDHQLYKPTDIDTAEAPGSEFLPVDIASKSRSVSRRRSTNVNAFAYARPGPNILSVLIDACIRMHAMNPAQDYWGLLTDPSGAYRILPDAENYHMYLRLLRVKRASKDALTLVEEMRRGLAGDPEFVVQAKTLRIAMSCCVRDKNNPNVGNIAARLMRIMYETLEDADVKTVEMYLQIATSIAQQREDAGMEGWHGLMNALMDMELAVGNWRSYLTSYGMKGKNKDVNKSEVKMSEVMTLCKRMTGAYDRVLYRTENSDGVSKDERRGLMERRNRLMKWMLRYTKEEKKGYRLGNRDGSPRLTADSEEGNGNVDEEVREDDGRHREGGGTKILAGFAAQRMLEE